MQLYGKVFETDFRSNVSVKKKIPWRKTKMLWECLCVVLFMPWNFLKWHFWTQFETSLLSMDLLMFFRVHLPNQSLTAGLFYFNITAYPQKIWGSRGHQFVLCRYRWIHAKSFHPVSIFSAKKGGRGDLARHIFFWVKIVYSNWILKNRDKSVFGI